jgi:hypothetical protein
MLFMAIERFKDRDRIPVQKRVRDGEYRGLRMTFEIVPVVPSKEARKFVAPLLGRN